MSTLTTEALPGVGQTWLADFPEGPWGHFAAELTFDSATYLSFVVTEGPDGFKGLEDAMDYATIQVRPGLFVVRWHEPKSGAYVTHIQDWAAGTVVASIVLDQQFVALNGTLT